MVVASLIEKGLALGIVHVLTGPDHLSAVALLSANVGWKKAFPLGLQWGVGHSAGLLLVGVFFLLLSQGEFDMPDYVSTAFDYLVGIFMILLGSYGIQKALEKHRRRAAYAQLPSVDLGHDQAPEAIIALEEEEDGRDLERDNDGQCRCFKSQWRRIAALGAGVIHGFSGPGGVLGILPAVQLHNGLLASIYLATFCASSCLTMGIFSTIYGALSKRIGKHNERFIEVFSACLSLFVGCLWLFLLAIGKLGDIFP